MWLHGVLRYHACSVHIFFCFLALDLAKSRLFWILQVLLDCSTECSPWTLQLSLESLTFTLCRLPQVHALIMTPPALIGEGTVSEKVLDQALMESEVSAFFHGLPLASLPHYHIWNHVNPMFHGRSYSSLCKDVIHLAG